MPRLFITQPENCCPVHHALHPDLVERHAPEYSATVAEGTAIRNPIRMDEMIEAIRGTGGDSAIVSESDIIATAKRLAAKGFYTEPTSAHSVAGLQQLVEAGRIGRDEETVVILTGSGLKATQFYA